MVLHLLDCRTTESFHSDIVIPLQGLMHFQSIDVFRNRITEDENATSFFFCLMSCFDVVD